MSIGDPITATMGWKVFKLLRLYVLRYIDKNIKRRAQESTF